MRDNVLADRKQFPEKRRDCQRCQRNLQVTRDSSMPIRQAMLWRCCDGVTLRSNQECAPCSLLAVSLRWPGFLFAFRVRTFAEGRPPLSVFAVNQLLTGNTVANHGIASSRLASISCSQFRHWPNVPLWIRFNTASTEVSRVRSRDLCSRSCSLAILDIPSYLIDQAIALTTESGWAGFWPTRGLNRKHGELKVHLNLPVDSEHPRLSSFSRQVGPALQDP
jgi:hypothetical protein